LLVLSSDEFFCFPLEIKINPFESDKAFASVLKVNEFHKKALDYAQNERVFAIVEKKIELKSLLAQNGSTWFSFLFRLLTMKECQRAES